MRVAFATEPGTPGKPSEDWALAASGLAVVLDGATVRTDTGCTHGVSWYAGRLGSAIVANVDDQVDLRNAVGNAITSVAALHQDCDLAHPGTPSAAVCVVRINKDTLEYFILGDITLLIESSDELSLVTDDRVSRTAQPARAEAERFLIGSPEKADALLRMKRGELAARNRPGGYWVSAADPIAVDHSIVGRLSLEGVNRLALLTDGAARALAFGLMTQRELLDALESEGPAELVRRVRDAEAGDPLGERWPRNKRSDDCTAIYVDLRVVARVDVCSMSR